MYTTEEIEHLMKQATDWKLDGTDRFSDRPVAELQNICNGIGAEWMPQWMRKIADELNPTLEPVALIHDFDYCLGGSEADREIADDRFYSNGVRAAKARYSWYDPRRYFVIGQARRFHALLRHFGNLAWSHREEA